MTSIASPPSDVLEGSPLDLVPVLPVVVISDLEHAVPLAKTLMNAGIRAIEVTLRSDVALAAVRAIVNEVPDITVGVGTIVNGQQVDEALAAGARFLVSPGATERLLDDLQAAGVPFLAGTTGPSDVMRLLERGITEAKLFPAEVVGGQAMLRALAGPLPQMRFCPTGGITATTAPDYLALPNVGCVGGTWIAPAELLVAENWSVIGDRARQAAALRPTL
ncbi:MAG TPA: bifunctional 4-hydroxy-2-oxoglutarate aldolase/2-dehydro-3-deoxy-phosphogluconate aldolase [Jatrophihabitans sp.]|jgi:2-dehydro-3-deoxyphosphogluconate aldolase/(4S)-4-hydroxy-2-oxoglutarate aldolase